MGLAHRRGITLTLTLTLTLTPTLTLTLALTHRRARPSTPRPAVGGGVGGSDVEGGERLGRGTAGGVRVGPVLRLDLDRGGDTWGCRDARRVAGLTWIVEETHRVAGMHIGLQAWPGSLRRHIGLQGCTSACRLGLDHGGDELLQLLRVLRRQRVEPAWGEAWG